MIKAETAILHFDYTYLNKKKMFCIIYALLLNSEGGSISDKILSTQFYWNKLTLVITIFLVLKQI
jgi:hypothetical protein